MDAVSQIVTFHENAEERRGELFVDGVLAGTVKYYRRGTTVSLLHTEVAADFTGQGIAAQLATHVLDSARDRGFSVLAFCPYIATFIWRHADMYLELVPDNRRHDFNL